METRKRRSQGGTDIELVGINASEEPLPPAQFRTLFSELVGQTLSRSTASASRNRQLEALLAQQTGWPSVAVKFVSSSKQTKNRISEIRNKPDRPAHAVLLAPWSLINNVVRLATQYVGVPGGFSTVSVATTDSDPPRIADLIFEDTTEMPRAILAAFPEARLHPIQQFKSEKLQVADREQDRHAVSSIVDFIDQTGIEAPIVESWLRRLKRKKHLVFQGPPGTGKSFVAKRLAQLLVSGSEDHIETVQFHPSYSYEDFVQGIRPTVRDGQVVYSVQPGRFLRFCDSALKSPRDPFVMIIDEMNRGNLSRIFGELLFLLEYRRESIPLAQGADVFSVPENVFLIATMNTADRSIALVDHALRRRFSFVFLGPDYELLRRRLDALHFDSNQLVDVLQRINAQIEDRNYHLGVSFFLSAGATLRDSLQEIWEGEIEPYLDEYFFDQPMKVDEFRWGRLTTSALSWWTTLGTAGTDA